MAKNPQFHGKAKHIDIRYHFIREQIELGVIRLEYCPTEVMTADMLTKGLNGHHTNVSACYETLLEYVNYTKSSEEEY